MLPWCQLAFSDPVYVKRVFPFGQPAIAIGQLNGFTIERLGKITAYSPYGTEDNFGWQVKKFLYAVIPYVCLIAIVLIAYRADFYDGVVSTQARLGFVRSVYIY
jgi:hypothetical protein